MQSAPLSPVGSTFWAPAHSPAATDTQSHEATRPVREAPAAEDEAPMARRALAAAPLTIEDLELALTLNYATKEGIAMRQRYTR